MGYTVGFATSGAPDGRRELLKTSAGLAMRLLPSSDRSVEPAPKRLALVSDEIVTWANPKRAYLVLSPPPIQRQRPINPVTEFL